MGSVICEHCTGACCRYIALPMDKPTTRRDFDDMRWFVMHRGVSVFQEDGDWYVQFSTPCRHLQADCRCGIYPVRPEICGEYKAGDCDYEGGDYNYECVLNTPEEVEQFAIRVLGRRGVFSTRADQPAPVPDAATDAGTHVVRKLHVRLRRT